jgi:hypothetical protein
MSRREIADRVAMRADMLADRWRWQLRRPSWRREDLARALDPSIEAMRDAARLLLAGDANRAHRVVSAHFAARPARFFIAPHTRDLIARTVRRRFPVAPPDARRRADRALAGCLDVLGYQGLSFARSAEDARIDWFRDPVHDRRPPLRHWSLVPYLDPAVGDPKIIWELNRHQHWLTLGRAYWLTNDRRYRDGFIDQLEGWLEDNPPHTGINWASMLELAFRALSWMWALHFFVEDADERFAAHGIQPDQVPWTVDLLLGLHTQLNLVSGQLSTYSSPNTHLLGEALALYVAGRVLPELGPARRWEAIGRDVLLREVDRQILPDGGHAELSAHYHRYTLDFYLHALVIARNTGDTLATAPFARAAERLAGFAHTLSDRRLHLPQLGDDDGGVLLPICGGDARDVGPSLAVAAAVLEQPELADGRPREDVVWLTSTAPLTSVVTDRRASAWLPDSGYIVSRTWRGDHLVMDVGRLGYLNAGHAHADALSITLTIAGRPMLIDPGTGCYTIDPALRDRLRATAAHNTVTLDGRWQSEPAGPFHWHSQARAAVHAAELTPRFDFVEASHDGYGPDGHRRQLFVRPGCWLVIDWIGGDAERHAAAHWHLDPAWRAQPLDERRVELRHVSGIVVWMVTLSGEFETYSGDGNGLGWHAPAYGSLQPITTLRVVQTARPPFALATAIVESDEPPRIEPLTALAPGGRSSDPLGFELATDAWREIVVAAGPHTREADGASFGIAARARLLCRRVSSVGVIDTWLAQARDTGDAHVPVAPSRVASLPGADDALAASVR